MEKKLKVNALVLDFSAFFKLILKEKYIFFPILLLFTGLGAYKAFTTQEEFVSEVKMLPEIQGKMSGLSQIAGLAGLSGIDFSTQTGNVDAIRPDLYPDVLASTSFYLDLFRQKVNTRDNKTMTFAEFYHEAVEGNEKIKEEFLRRFPVKDEAILVIDRLSEKRITDLKNRIKSSIDRKSGVVSISVKMPDPVVAAKVASFSMEYLKAYITEYRIEKLKKEVDFLTERVQISRGKFFTVQERKARYADQFQAPTIRVQSADIQRERLESEYRLSSGFYNELLKKLEEAKIKLHQETPIFKTLEPPVVPNLKSEPKRAIILIVSAMTGGIIALITILSRKKNYRSVFRSIATD